MTRRNHSSARRILTTLTLAIAATTATAHEFWIECSSARPALGELVQARLWLGERFRGEPVLRDASRYQRFTVTGPDGERDVPGRDASTLAGMVRCETPGTHMLALETEPTAIELSPGAFDAYLLEDGLAHIAEIREARGEQDETAHERYSRCAKALLAGAGDTDGFDRRAGLTLELTPLTDPDAPADQPMTILLEYHGEPLAGVMVTAAHTDTPNDLLSARTDEHGLVTLDLTDNGLWLVSGVHMTEDDPAAGTDASEGGPTRWRSHWASLTFERQTSF